MPRDPFLQPSPRSLDAIGRPRSEVELSIQFRYPNDDARMLDLVDTYLGYGADHILVSFSPGTDTAIVPLVADVLASR